jgi:FixJ family two-component response regulator
LDQQTTIAIVDDDEAVRSGISRLLRSLGFAAISFSSAEEFLSSGQARKSSCLITDVRMPGMSGIELQDELIAQGFELPIIFMTAFDEEQTRSRAINAGAHEFLTKPFKEETLINSINAALEPC